MYLLYEKFVQQAKREDIERYNVKHRDYLVRAGKLKQEGAQKMNGDIQNQGGRVRPVREREFRKQPRNPIVLEVPSEMKVANTNERPLNGTGRYNLNEDGEPEVMINPRKWSLKHEIKVEQVNEPKKIVQNARTIQPNVKDIMDSKPKPINNVERVPQNKTSFPVDENELVQHAEVELIDCPENCGRKFNAKALQKHIKICQKGEQKRRVYKVKVVDEEAEKMKKDEPVVVAKKEEVPKWKKESEQLRNQIQNKQVVDQRKQCPGCGRKFDEKAAERHIEKCMQRATVAKRR